MIEPDEIRSLLDYDAETGDLVWRVRGALGWDRKNAGKVAGAVTTLGYVLLRIKREQLRAHRVAWAHYYGEWPSGEVDHINGDRADNRIANLRVVAHAENGRNCRPQKRMSPYPTGVIYVQKDRRWRAYIRVNYRQFHLGCFLTMEDAVAARKAAELAHGFHANHGKTTDEINLGEVAA